MDTFGESGWRANLLDGAKGTHGGWSGECTERTDFVVGSVTCCDVDALPGDVVDWRSQHQPLLEGR